MVGAVGAARVHHAAAVPVQAELADVAVVRRGVENREDGLAAQAGDDAKFIGATRRVARLLPVAVEAEAVRTPPHREQATAVQKRVREQMRAKFGEELLGAFDGRRFAVGGPPVAFHRGKKLLAACLERAQPFRLRLETVRPAPRHVGPREAHVFDFHRLQTADGAAFAVLRARRRKRENRTRQSHGRANESESNN